MSRLIDADKLKNHYSWWEDDERRTLFDQIVDAQPTVDAIPISFIEKKIESIRQYLSEHEGEEFTSGLISKAIAYEKLIEEWREKNGTETN